MNNIEQALLRSSESLNASVWSYLSNSVMGSMRINVWINTSFSLMGSPWILAGDSICKGSLEKLQKL